MEGGCPWSPRVQIDIGLLRNLFVIMGSAYLPAGSSSDTRTSARVDTPFLISR